MQAVQSTRMELQSLGDSIARDRDRKAVLERLNQGASQDLENVSVAPPTPATGQSADPNALLERHRDSSGSLRPAPT